MVPKDTDLNEIRRTALVVESDTVQLAATVRALRALDYAVEAASTFDEARQRLLSIPDLTLLVADIRLGQFNGLHLAFRARAHHPSVRVVIIDHAMDATLEAETKRLGGVYIAKPFTTEALVALISRPDERLPPHHTGTRRWTRTPVAGVIAAVGRRSARLFDVSYGGLCLEFPPGDFDPALPSTVNVELQELGLSVRMHPVWVRTASSSPTWFCGGELLSSDSSSMVEWRRFVDSRLPA